MKVNRIPPDTQRAPSGYLSEEHKRKFTITAGILGAIFFIVQFILPFGVMMAIMPGMMFFGDSWMEIARPERGAFWNHQIWYVGTSISPKRPDGDRVTLKSLKVEGNEGPKNIGLLPMENPWLLAGADKLWIISSSKVGFFQDGNIKLVSEEKVLGEISRPFLYKGHPAVIEEGPNGFAFVVFVDGAWQRKAPFTLKLRERLGRIQDSFQVVSRDDKLHLFLKFGDTLYYRERLPEEGAEDQDRWRPISEVKRDWFAILLDGELSVFVQQAEEFPSRIVGLKLEGGTWKSFFSYDVGMTTEMGIYPLGQPRKFALLRQSFPGSLRLVHVDGGRVLKETRHGKGFPFPDFFGVMMLGFYGPTLLLPLVLAVILSSLMKKHRICEHQAGSMTMPFASITRRALSQIVDFFVLGAPAIAGVLLIFPIFDMEKMLRSGPFPLAGFGLILGEIFWGIFCLFAYSFLEGRWGIAPGKWVVGIRVLGTDLRPCGFGRALVRNLLKFIDGFFNSMVGILLAALTENWQRVGDMAARTVVVRVKRELILDVE
jgi:uncharacterized RDD family membrane protein YckC